MRGGTNSSLRHSGLSCTYLHFSPIQSLHSCQHCALCLYSAVPSSRTPSLPPLPQVALTAWFVAHMLPLGVLADPFPSHRRLSLFRRLRGEPVPGCLCKSYFCACFDSPSTQGHTGSLVLGVRENAQSVI